MQLATGKDFFSNKGRKYTNTLRVITKEKKETNRAMCLFASHCASAK